MLAPHAPRCAAVTAHERDATATGAHAHATTPAASTPGARTARYHRAILLARLFATFPLVCPQCGAVMHNLGCKMMGEQRWCPVAELEDPGAEGWVAGRYLRESSY